MRIFNGTNSLLTLPLSGNQRLEILPKSVSQEFMGSKEFLSMVVTSLGNDEIAIVVSGVYELNTCANVPTAVNYVVQSLDEAIVRFGIKKKTEPKHEECTCEKCRAEKTEEKPVIREEVVIPETTEKPVEEEPIEEPKKEEVIPEEAPTENVEVEKEEKPAKKSRKKKKAEE